MDLLTRADPNTIQDKVLVGYQGWFTCAGDGPPIDPGHHGWLHWFNTPLPNGGRPNIDLWPDTSAYDPDELYPAPGLATASGDPVHLFSSRHPKTVRRHFHWMAHHGVDGAFLQRFAGQCEIKAGNHGIRDLRDEVGDRVREAAEAAGRVYAIMYDVSGVSPDKIQTILEQDWTHLVQDKHLLDSPSYLRERGRPVVALWGFGFNGRNHTPALVRAITGFFRAFTPGGVYLVAGTPGHWRTSTSDADRNPDFVSVWTDCFDAISPWTVGRYGNEDEADQWGQGRLKADADYLTQLTADGGRHVDYIPVVLPGGSGFNLSEGKWRMNDMRRNGGQFLWRQIVNAHRAGVRTIYGAMWDEYDEGTVFMPVVSHASELPVHASFRFLALDVDGEDLPSDWYMRVIGVAAEVFHKTRAMPEDLPVDELRDTRPEDGNKAKDTKGPDVDGATRAVKAWDLSDVPSDAPPPYTLEDASPQSPRGPPPARPAVRQDTRPSGGDNKALAAAAVTGAAIAAVGVAASKWSESGSGATSPTYTPPPPPVNMSSRPTPPPGPPHRAASELGPPPFRGSPEMRMPHGPGSPSPPLPQGLRPGYPHGRVGSIGGGGGVYAPPPGPPPPPGAPPPPGPPPHSMPGRGYGYERRGRSRSRSHSRSRSRSPSPSRRYKHPHQGRRSRSRSEEGPRRVGTYPGMGMGMGMGMQAVHGSIGHGHGHGYGVGPQGQGHAQTHHGHAPPPHGHGYGYGQGQGHGHHSSMSPVGSPGGMPFPGAGAGAGGGALGGGYTPVQSHPVGYGHGHGYGQAYPGQGQGPYAQGGCGQGPGYGQGYGYAPPPPQHPSGSGYYSPYGPTAGASSYPVGGGPGGIQGGIASALQAVEGIAGPQTRKTLEKTVKSLSNTGSTLLNKLK